VLSCWSYWLKASQSAAVAEAALLIAGLAPYMARKARIDFKVERDPDTKGSYRRRLDDAFKAAELMLAQGSVSPALDFIINFFACEKVAKVILGIASGKPGSGPAFKNIKIGRTHDLFLACGKLSLSVTKAEINAIFAEMPGTACELRNKYSMTLARRTLVK
jgi:hypothetical protein